MCMEKRTNSAPEQGMLEDMNHMLLLEGQIAAFDGYSHNFHMQYMQPRCKEEEEKKVNSVSSNIYLSTIETLYSKDW
jgi:hypothetical protein